MMGKATQIQSLADETFKATHIIIDINSGVFCYKTYEPMAEFLKFY